MTEEDAYDDMPMGWFLLGGFALYCVILCTQAIMANLAR